MKKYKEQYTIKLDENSLILFTIKRKILGGADLYGSNINIRGDGKTDILPNKKYDCDSLGKIEEHLRSNGCKQELDKVSNLFNIMSILNNITWYYC